MVKHNTLIVIAGPTAVGKTAVAIQLARVFSTDIISADSRQIFREMNVGTAKPSASELQEAKHHFIDTHSVAEDYDAAQFGEDALTLIQQIFLGKKYVILCGGSGLYIKAVCEGFDDIPEIPEGIREDLISNFESSGIGWLQEKMKELDPTLLPMIDQQNPHRLIRALEVRIATGKSISSFRLNKKAVHDFNIIKIGLELPREVLYERIDKRMDKMIEQGLFEEARALYPFKSKNALQTVGYQEIFGLMENLYDYEEAVRLLKRNSRRYAKRQLTWFKKDTDFTWFQPHQIDDIVSFINSKTQ